MKKLTSLNVLLLFISILFWYFSFSWRREAYRLQDQLIFCQQEHKQPAITSLHSNVTECRWANDKLRGELHKMSLVLAEKSREARHAQRQGEAAAAAAGQQKSECHCAPCKQLLDVLHEGGLCTANVSDTEVWNEAARDLPWLPRGGNVRGELFPNGSYAHFTTRGGPGHAQWYCDKLYTNLEPYVKPQGSLSAEDVIIGVYSGEMIHVTRASASSATWMTRFPHAYIYSAEPSETVPVVGIGQRYGLQPDYRDMRDLQKLAMLMYRDLYLRHPTAKWFYTVGDDTFVVADSLVRMLSEHDASEEVWLVNWPGERDMDNTTDLSLWPERNRIVDERHKFYWQTGAIGWFISNPLARKFAANVERFLQLQELRDHDNCNCPDIYTGMLLTLIGGEPRRIPAEWASGLTAASESTFGSGLDRAPELVMLHYQQPRRMLGMEQWFEHRRLDRMVNGAALAMRDNDADAARSYLHDIVHSYRFFINAKMDALRRWQGTVTRLAQKYGAPLRTYDIPLEGAVWPDNAPDWLPANETDAEAVLSGKGHAAARQPAHVAAQHAAAVRHHAPRDAQPDAVAPPEAQDAPQQLDPDAPDAPPEPQRPLAFKKQRRTSLPKGGRCAADSAAAPPKAVTPFQYEVEMVVTLRQQLHALMLNATGDVCSCSDDFAATGTAIFFGFCQRRPSFVQLADHAALGWTGLDDDGQKLEPRHWGHRYEQLLPLLLERFRGSSVRVVLAGGVHGVRAVAMKHYFGALADIAVINHIHPLDFHLSEQSELDLREGDKAELRRAYETELGVYFAGAPHGTGPSNALERFGGELDVVIDDMTHEYSDQLHLFAALFPSMTRGGVYVVAGLNVAYENGAGSSSSSPTWIATTKAMLDTLNRRVFDIVRHAFATFAEPATHTQNHAALRGGLDQLVQSVHCAEEVCAYIRA